jgi:hypothetical protein
VWSYDYLTPTGNRADKRLWRIGTPVSAALKGGVTLKGVTASVPQDFGGGAWGVRLHGVTYVVPLELVDVRYQPDMLEIPNKGASGSDKES